MTPSVITFSKEKETRNMVRYQEDSKAPIIGTLYISKQAIIRNGEFPSKVKVTLEVIE